MIPQLIPTAKPGEYLLPPRRRSLPFVDWAFGSDAPGDVVSSRDKVWTSVAEGDDYFIFIEGSTSRLRVLSKPGVTRFSFDFDQLMRPVIGYSIGADSFVEVPTPTGVDLKTYAGCRDICINFDDSRPISANLSDVLLTMIRGADIICYVQREAYAVEHRLATGATSQHRIYNSGLTLANRFQWKVTPQL